MKNLHSSSFAFEIGADEWNRTITMSPSQASETCASTSSATSARLKRQKLIYNLPRQLAKREIRLRGFCAAFGFLYH